VVEKIHNY